MISELFDMYLFFNFYLLAVQARTTKRNLSFLRFIKNLVHPWHKNNLKKLHIQTSKKEDIINSKSVLKATNSVKGKFEDICLKVINSTKKKKREEEIINGMIQKYSQNLRIRQIFEISFSFTPKQACEVSQFQEWLEDPSFQKEKSNNKDW